MDAKIEQLRRFVAESDNIVFFGGAGVSTESGIPDFRSVDGLYHQKFKYPPETILSHHFYETHKAEFFDFYRQKMLAPDAQPNAAHRKLAELERAGKLKAVITQNIDGLCWSCTGASCATIVRSVGSFTGWRRFSTPRAFRAAAAAGRSSPTSCSMRRVSTRT